MSNRFFDLLSLDPDTGFLTWKERDLSLFDNRRLGATWNGRYAGKRAGYSGPKGYRDIKIKGKKYLEHRVIWEMLNGPILPEHEIDHLNGDRADNRPTNLRCVPHTTNMRNIRKKTCNSSGFTGVHFHKANGRWVAQSSGGGKRYLGSFKTPEDAFAAVEADRTDHDYTERHGR
jgi:hypothetical protein